MANDTTYLLIYGILSMSQKKKYISIWDIPIIIINTNDGDDDSNNNKIELSMMNLR